ncbi:MAG: DegT/DnrJ/EryC1/StrS family aminotransferase [Chlorobi bacterium]|nr:DegT/DnrJ/EryC1/StrS family aminotransferase [Chlorobiota bacterium]
MIPFLDLNRLNSRYLPAFHRRLDALVRGGRLILGEAVEEFERRWADYSGYSFAVGTASGFSALQLVLEAWKLSGKVREGDEAVVPAHTYVATILPVVRAGLKPVAVEPEPDLNMHPEAVERVLTSRTRVIIPVHLYGRRAPMEALARLARRHGLLLLDDAAQAHGAIRKGDGIARAHATAWSFYPTKNLGALGDGGAVTTDDEELARLVAVLRHYGQEERYNSRYPGTNARLDALQAAFLSEKLPDLDRLNARRVAIARRYAEGIRHPLVRIPPFEGDGSHVYHQFVICSPRRDALRAYLADKGIATLIHYPVPPHRQQALQGILEGEFPVTERIAREILSLPADPLMSDEEVETVISAVNAF